MHSTWLFCLRAASVVLLFEASAASPVPGCAVGGDGCFDGSGDDPQSLLQMHHLGSGAAHAAGADQVDTGGVCASNPDPGKLVWEATPTPGGLVRGTLSVPLDYDGPSPMLELKVTMIFSKVQPAPHGPLLMHFGGPGSYDTLLSHRHAVEGYDTWSISQRGIGPDAKPALQCTGSHLPPSGKSPPFKISDFTECPCALPDDTPMVGETWADIDPRNESQVRLLFSQMTKRSMPCYNSPKFQLKGPGGQKYNFLDYVGTQMLAMDIDRFREAIGAKHMSVHGMSYGTLVGAVYATVFPQHVFRMILNGNMMSLPDREALSVGCAGSMQKAVAKLLRDCANLPQNCSLVNPDEEYNQIVQAARNGKLVAPTKLGTLFPMTVGMLSSYLQNILHSSSGSGWPDADRFLSLLSPRNENPGQKEELVAKVLDTYCFVGGVATWSHYGICVGPGSTAQLEVPPGESQPGGDAFIEQVAVLAADTSGRYRVDDAMALWQSVALKYEDVGLTSFTGIFAGVFDWGGTPTPPAPLGNPLLPALVVGNLYDPSTSYAWSQRMRQSFPSGSMMTWQGVGHVLPTSGDGTYDPSGITECSLRMTDYLTTGELPLDGHLCHERVAVPVRVVRPSA